MSGKINENDKYFFTNNYYIMVRSSSFNFDHKIKVSSPNNVHGTYVSHAYCNNT